MPSLPARRAVALATRSGPRELIVRAVLRPFAAQTAQDAALAALLGGNLFGRVAMHPALHEISDQTERGRVLNSAWRRYGTVNSAALAILVGGWIQNRSDQAGRLWTSPVRRRLVLAKDVAVGAVVVTGLASAIGGVEFAQQAPEGAVPLRSGSEPSSETPRRAAKLKRAMNVIGGLNLAAELALVVVNAAVSRRTSRLL
jgi:uncharacterized membrane protein